jgi:hypothetical protein
MINLDLFGQTHRFQLKNCDQNSIQSAVDLIEKLAHDLALPHQKERAYLTLLIKMAMLYLAEKNDAQDLKNHIDKVNNLCDMIEQSLGQTQSTLVLEV